MCLECGLKFQRHKELIRELKEIEKKIDLDMLLECDPELNMQVLELISDEELPKIRSYIAMLNEKGFNLIYGQNGMGTWVVKISSFRVNSNMENYEKAYCLADFVTKAIRFGLYRMRDELCGRESKVPLRVK